MRCSLLGLFWMACAPAALPLPPPDAPRIVLPDVRPGEPFRQRSVRLILEAADDTTVRVFPSSDCSGVELVRQPAPAARAGVTLETPWGRNVFSAEAISPVGVRSPCSPAVTLEVRFPLRGTLAAPVVTQVLPRNPSAERVVRLRGIAMFGWTVAVWLGDQCEGQLLAEGPASQFEGEGLAVELPYGRGLRVTLDASKDETLTACSAGVRLVHDIGVPDVNAAFLFPRPPHAFSFASIVVPGLTSAAFIETYQSPDCSGALTPGVRSHLVCATENACTGFVSGIPVATNPVGSLRARSSLGNFSACRAFEHRVSFEGRRPVLAARFGVDERSLVVSAPDDRFPPQLFRDAECAAEVFPLDVVVAAPAPWMSVFGDVPRALWLRRQTEDGLLNCEPVPP